MLGFMVYFTQKNKNILKLIWNEFIYGGHLLSLGATSVVLTSSFLLDIKITWDCLILVYLGSQIVYLYDRIREIKNDLLTNFDRTQYIKKNFSYLALAILVYSLVFFGILLYFNKLFILIFTSILLFLGLSYSRFFKKKTKNIIGFKNLFVSFIWSLLIVFLTFYYYSSFSVPFFLIFSFVFLRLLIHEIFSDAKDVLSDKNQKLLTLPIIFGRKKTIIILQSINIISLTPLFFGIYYNFFPISSIILSFAILYTSFYLYMFERNKKHNMNSYYAFTDGEYILWAPLFLIGKSLI
jgi:4-hydroxybenzoate polyprenyltransferase